MPKTCVVVLNWNGKDSLGDCLDSLLKQSEKAQIIVVDNGSTDGSVKYVESKYAGAILIKHRKNLGFSGGVNAGIKKAMELEAKYVALLNNDAVADKAWLKHLVDFLEANPKAGIATSKIIDAGKKKLDSTGEQYSIWGLPFPRGRGEKAIDKYDNDVAVFGASGGASLYRVKTLEEIGLFDEDFFAYYEDVDISFRAQLAGWKVIYVPEAIVYHQTGTTSAMIKDFYAYQTLKNLPLLMWKNVPWKLMSKIWPRLVVAYTAFIASALARGQIWAVAKGLVMGTILWPKKLVQRYKIQKNRRVTPEYINSIITHDLPPTAQRLRNLRTLWWKMVRKEQ